MNTVSHAHSINVRVIDSIEFSAREANFLRKMARYCIRAGMPGSGACEHLIAILDAARIPARDDEPTYGIFEAPNHATVEHAGHRFDLSIDNDGYLILRERSGHQLLLLPQANNTIGVRALDPCADHAPRKAGSR